MKNNKKTWIIIALRRNSCYSAVTVSTAAAGRPVHRYTSKFYTPVRLAHRAAWRAF
jgi:hypothetical protein